jgi:hypothetical protein
MRWLIVIAAFACRRDVDPSRFLNEHPDVPACRNSAKISSLPAWNGSEIRIGFIARAPRACPGPGFPFVSAEGEGRWIQIVKLDASSFVDVEEKLRSEGKPFVNATGGSFWDNPVFAVRPEHDRVWSAHTYLVSTNGGSVRAIGGFSWGWTWRAAENHPDGVAPQPLARGAWHEDLPVLRAAYPAWQFE